MTRTSGAAPAVLAAVLLAAPARGQTAPPSRLTWAGPDVTLASEDEDATPARAGTPLLAGDRVATGSSRAEALLAGGASVRFDADTEARLDGDGALTLVFGAVAVEPRRAVEGEPLFRVDTEDASVNVPAGALVRVDRSRRGTVVTVRAGWAGVSARAGRVAVRAGASASVRDAEAFEVTAGDLPDDPFTRFVERRRESAEGPSLRTLRKAAADRGAAWDDRDLASDAALLDAAGTWVWLERCGQLAFRPRVPADWRPFGAGSWRYTPSGMTWAPDEPWGWLTSHYGTWVYDDTYGWLWCPGFAYSPAWVAWDIGPSWIGWCALGADAAYEVQNPPEGRWEPKGNRPRGPVVVTKAPPRAWSYARADRVGARLEARDIVRGDRVGFRPGAGGTVTSGPLRVERTPGQSVRSAVAETFRRIAPREEPARIEGSRGEAQRHASGAASPRSGSSSRAEGARTEHGGSISARSEAAPAPARIDSTPTVSAPRFDPAPAPIAPAPEPVRSEPGGGVHRGPG